MRVFVRSRTRKSRRESRKLGSQSPHCVALDMQSTGITILIIKILTIFKSGTKGGCCDANKEISVWDVSSAAAAVLRDYFSMSVCRKYWTSRVAPLVCCYLLYSYCKVQTPISEASHKLGIGIALCHSICKYVVSKRTGLSGRAMPVVRIRIRIGT